MESVRAIAFMGLGITVVGYSNFSVFDMSKRAWDPTVEQESDIKLC